MKLAAKTAFKVEDTGSERKISAEKTLQTYAAAGGRQSSQTSLSCAPIASALLAHPTPAFERSLSPAAIKEAGFFDAPKTQLLLSKLRKNPSSTEVV
jgi:hypothetical protein